MITMKVAFVDIDGCLVSDGKLNNRLVERLQEYDEIILFTQRSKYFQIQQIPRAFILRDTPPEESAIVNTPDAVNALENVIPKRVRVSTSIDFTFGDPTAYYETVLGPFESALKEELKAKGDKFDRDRFNQMVQPETLALRSCLNTDENIPVDVLYPRDKVGQFESLASFLPYLLNVDSEQISIDYYDDSIQNLEEVKETNPKNTQLFLVNIAGGYIDTVENFRTQYGDQSPRDLFRKPRANINPTHTKPSDPILSLEVEEAPPSRASMRFDIAPVLTPFGGLGAAVLVVLLLSSFTPVGLSVWALAGAGIGAAVVGGLIAYGLSLVINRLIDNYLNDDPDLDDHDDHEEPLLDSSSHSKMINGLGGDNLTQTRVNNPEPVPSQLPEIQPDSVPNIMDEEAREGPSNSI